MVKVRVEAGPIGVKLSHNSPLKVLDIVDLPDGRPSPLKGKVDIGSIVSGRNHQCLS